MARTADSAREISLDDQLTWESEAVAWLEAKARYDEAKKQMDGFRSVLMEALDELGTEDENGHRYLHLTHEVGKWGAIQRQRRVSETTDMDKVNEILEQRGLTERCIEMVPQVNNDAVFACLYEGLLTEDEVYAMFPQKIQYALVAVKGK